MSDQEFQPTLEALRLAYEAGWKDRFDEVLNGAKFSEIVSGFLQSEADVSVYIECEPAELGLEDK